MPKNNPLRLIIDTNLWISFIISKSLYKIDFLILSGNATLLFSDDLVVEIEEVIAKPKLRKYFPVDALSEMLMAFESYIELVTVTSTVDVCRDPKDNFLLALAKDGSADYLLTGDLDLLVVQQYEKTEITTITKFLNKLK